MKGLKTNLTPFSQHLSSNYCIAVVTARNASAEWLPGLTM